ncbi:hypothetical protein, partial [Streptococcus pneumoniae]|uniref:hypothetical protein n=1 Tax=Streptococcus pneumoniae TaxID=1313 RepID=UPI001953E0B2
TIRYANADGKMEKVYICFMNINIAAIRNNYSLTEVEAIYNEPLLELVFKAAAIHREFNDTAEVQVCTLLSIKTG